MQHPIEISSAQTVARLAETFGVDSEATKQAMLNWLDGLGRGRSKHAAARHAAGLAKYKKKKAKRKGKR